MKAVRDAVSKNPEQDGPINWNAGVPFRLSPTLEMIWSTSGESKFVRPKIKNVDWDSFEYSFQLEKSVLESWIWSTNQLYLGKDLSLILDFFFINL